MRKIFGMVLALGAPLIFGSFEARADDANECIAMSGSHVENTCDYTVALGWYNGARQTWYLESGDSETLSGFANATDRVACTRFSLRWNGNSPYCN